MATTLSDGKLIANPTLPPPQNVVPKVASDGLCVWSVVGESPDGSILQFCAAGPIIPGKGPIITSGNLMSAPISPNPVPMKLFYQVSVTYTAPSDPLNWTVLLERQGAEALTFVRGNGGQ